MLCGIVQVTAVMGMKIEAMLMSFPDIVNIQGSPRFSTLSNTECLVFPNTCHRIRNASVWVKRSDVRAGGNPHDLP